MQAHELANKLEVILDEAKTGVLATADSNGRIHMRWMTPVVLKQRRGAIFAFSRPNAAKVDQIGASGQAAWMIQTRDLREIVHLSGPTRVIDNPALKAELMDIVGPRLAVFWKTNAPAEEFVVIETMIEEATWLKPMKASREIVTF
ncbi:MAG: pyridoxamine 5'-phosphate oxidase family protein [Phycisphaerae bacterium]|nr:pyridoxamine 5'-phosphate oxidase family protein [Phycisphaerae bacterium]